MKLSSVGIPLALSVALVGCSEEPSESETDATSAIIQGVIRVEQTIAEDGLASTISAKFLRAQPDDLVGAEKLVGTQLEIPAEGECILVSDVRSSRPSARGKSRPVDLVDVGDLTVGPSTASADDRAWQLSPRAFPDIGDLVSGVFYTQPDLAIEPVSGDAPSRYTITATGTAFVDPFTFDVDVPGVPANVRVGGQSIAKGNLPVVSVGRDLTVEWEEGEGLVYVDVHGSKTWRCTFKDTGAAVLPNDVLSKDDAQQAVVFSVHRLREESVRVDFQGAASNGAQKNAEFTSVRFDFARSGRVLAE